MANTTAILVLGMHRSGTSATAGWLHALGVNLGPYLMAEDPTQPKGYFEHAEIVGIHNDLMTAFDSSWDDPRPLPEGWEHDHRVRFFREQLMEIVRRDLMTQPLWGAKDPRLGSKGCKSLELCNSNSNTSCTECWRCRSGRARRAASNRCNHSPKSPMRWIG